MSSILSLLGTTIDYGQLAAFLLQRVRESSRHDYKTELPSEAEKIAKSLSAFGNTYGGVLLVGVGQASDGGPELPVAGLAGNPEQLASRVQQIANEGIDPPLEIDVQIVRIPDTEPAAGKHVLVVRVGESPQAPHAVLRTGGIYVRRADHSSKEVEVFPPLKALEVIFERRRGPEIQRETIWHRSLARIPKLHTAQPRFSIFVAPAFPRLALVSEQTAFDHLGLEGGTLVPIIGGAHAHGLHLNRLYFRDVYTVGAFFESGPIDNGNGIDFGGLASSLGGCWKRARAFLKLAHVHGRLLVRIQLTNVKGTRIRDRGSATCAEDTVQHEEYVDAMPFADSDTRLLEAVHHLRWGLGHPQKWSDDERAALDGLRS